MIIESIDQNQEEYTASKSMLYNISVGTDN